MKGFVFGATRKLEMRLPLARRQFEILLNPTGVAYWYLQSQQEIDKSPIDPIKEKIGYRA